MKYLSLSILIIFLIVFATSCTNPSTECEVDCKNYKMLGRWVTDSIIEYESSVNNNYAPPLYTYSGETTIYRSDTFNFSADDVCICPNSINAYYSYYNNTHTWDLSAWQSDTVMFEIYYGQNGMIIYNEGASNMFFERTTFQGAMGMITTYKNLYYLRKL